MLYPFRNMRHAAGIAILGCLMLCFGPLLLAGEGSTGIDPDRILREYIWAAKFNEALELSDQLLEQQVTDKENTAALQLIRCEIFLKQGNHADAAKMLTASGAIIDHLTRPGYPLLFQQAVMLGKYNLHTGDPEASLKWLKRAEYYCGKEGTAGRHQKADLYVMLAGCSRKLGEQTRGFRYYELAKMELTGTSRYDSIESMYCTAKIAEYYLSNQNTSEAGKLFTTCREFTDKTADRFHPALLRIYLTLATYYLMLGDELTEAERIIIRASTILNNSFPANHYQFGILYYLNNQLAYRRRDYEKALVFCEQSLNFANRYPELQPYRVLNYSWRVSLYYHYKRDFEKSIAYCLAAIDSLKGTPETDAYFYYIMARSYREAGDIARAAGFFHKAIQKSFENGVLTDKASYIGANHFLAAIYNKAGNYALTRSYLEKAMNVANTLVWPHKKRIVLFEEYGISYQRSGNYMLALRALQQAVIASCRTFGDTSAFANPVASDILFKHPLITVLNQKAYALYSVYEHHGRNINYLQAALRSQELAVLLSEKIIIGIDSEKSELTHVDWRMLTHDNAVSYATLLYLRTGDNQYAEKAFYYAEKSKMQVLTISTHRKSIAGRAGVPDSLMLLETQLNHEILNAENFLALEEKSGEPSNLKAELVSKLARLYDQRDDLTLSLERDYPEYYRLKHSSDVAGLDRIQKMLKADQVIVEYQLLETELIMLVITVDNISIHYQLNDTAFFKKIRQFRDALTGTGMQEVPGVAYRSFTTSAGYLYAKLIAPVYKEIKNKHLIIIPHKELNLLPFEALISSVPDGNRQYDYAALPYLVKEFPVSYAYTANLLLQQGSTKTPAGRIAAFVPEYPDHGKSGSREWFPPLAGAEEEAQAVRRLMGGKVFKGKRADEATLKNQASRYGLLHIASHTLIDDVNPSLSCLVMTPTADSAGDGRLYSFEISQMDLSAQLVVLSGCNTGIGKLLNGEGLISLARSFFYTGVRTVTYTLWPVADKASSSLTGSFYAGMKRDKPLDEALRTAKLTFLDHADPVKSHPYYWAGYVVVGRTEPLLLRGRYSRLLLVFCALLAVLAAFVIFRKVRD